MNVRKQQAILDDLTTYKEDGLDQLSQLNITVSPMDDIRGFIKDYGVTKPDPVDQKILLRDMIEEDIQKGGANEIEYFAYKIDFKAKHEPNRDTIELLPNKPEVPTLVLEPEEEGRFALNVRPAPLKPYTDETGLRRNPFKDNIKFHRTMPLDEEYISEEFIVLSQICNEYLMRYLVQNCLLSNHLN